MVPGRASVVRLNLKGPKTTARDYKFGWRQYERTRLIVI